MNETEVTKNWFARRAEAEVEAKKDTFPSSERIASIVGFVIVFLVILYFVAHQTGSTGFFSSKFNTLEMLLFYGSLLFGGFCTVLGPVRVRHRNLIRLGDMFFNITVTIATIWLFVVFPFEFEYFADVLPDFLRFLVQWISNDIARVVLVLGIIAYLGAAVYAPIAYGFVRKKRSKNED
ncbi:MAG: hypothetical protein KAR20_08445 [Candidatus Heimdallarchaeota archaeon]|nr:hypothetical protein [Candidatus Heimdallarchaeota archaeon]